MLKNFEALSQFNKKISKLGLEERLVALMAELTAWPEKGDLIPGTAGARKMRMAAEGRGKSGGYRVIYHLRSAGDSILFIYLYSKNEKENLTDKEKKEIARFIKGIK